MMRESGPMQGGGENMHEKEAAAAMKAHHAYEKEQRMARRLDR